MAVYSYTEHFWGGDLGSKRGFEALTKRVREGKVMCEEMETYLKKRSKLENEFAKSLCSLVKCFEHKDNVGDLEATLNLFKQELDTMAKSHIGAAVFFSDQAGTIKCFRDEQAAKAKQVIDTLEKAQSDKRTNLKRTQNLESTYMKKNIERDRQQEKIKEVEKDGAQNKELEKALKALAKAKEEVDKADEGYRTGVLMLETSTNKWERTMEKACQIIQELDEDRVRQLRQELWTCVNVDSKMALDIDHCCENVRVKLETCDVSRDIYSFMKFAHTGGTRPEYYKFKPYTTGSRCSDSDGDSSNSSTIDDDNQSKTSNANQQNSFLGKFKKHH